MCQIDVEWFPFDIQTCEMKFGKIKSYYVLLNTLTIANFIYENLAALKTNQHNLFIVKESIQ